MFVVDHELTLRAWPLGHRGCFDVMMSFGSNNCFVIGALFTNGGHGYDFTSSVGHPKSNSVGLLVYIWRYAYNIRGTDVVLQVHRDNVNPTDKGLISRIDHIDNNYDFIYTFTYIACFPCIKILMFVTRIMSHQFFKINYILLCIIMKATHIIL
jgi:hypothetical protein